MVQKGYRDHRKDRCPTRRVGGPHRWGTTARDGAMALEESFAPGLLVVADEGGDADYCPGDAGGYP